MSGSRAGPGPGRLRTLAALVGSVVLAAAVVRAATTWTADRGPMPTQPPSVAALEAELALEVARADALQMALDDLVAGSVELATALDTAETRLDERVGAAQGLRTELAAARVRLEGLQRALVAAGRR